MANLVFVVPSWTPVAVADTTNFTDAGHMSLKGGSSTQRTKIKEVFCGGVAGSSAPTLLQLARHSTVGATLTALGSGNSEEPYKTDTAALAAPVTPFIASTTKPQADVNAKLGSFAFNAFGGAIRKEWAPGEEPNMLGNAASAGELGLNAFTGGTPGLMGSHIVYETE